METVKIPNKKDLDAAYIEPLIHEWLQHVHENDAKRLQIFREGKEFAQPYMAVPMPVIKTIFVIAEHFGLGPNTRYLTVHLFDKFMCNHFSELYLAETIKDQKQTTSWEFICNTISSQAKLRLMSCMQLASKMDSHSRGLGISQVIRWLRWLDDKSEYTKNNIYASEFYVYKTVGFKIPLFTPLHSVEILLAGIDLRSQAPQSCDVCVDLLDLAYLQHDRIYSQLQFIKKEKSVESEIESGNIMELESNVLYLGAAVVLCSNFILSAEDSEAKNLVKTLSDLVGIKEINIQQMAELLFAMAVQQEDDP